MHISPVLWQNNILIWCQAWPKKAESADRGASSEDKKGTAGIPWNNLLSFK